jgi:CheY-like chemotaxis protein
MSQRIVVGIFNSSLETLEILRELLTDEGYFPVVAHVDDVRAGKLDMMDFVAAHRPALVIWDIAPPYAENWTFFKLVTSVPEVAKVPFLITTTNERALSEIAGVEDAIELVGKPYDLEQILKAIRHRIAAAGKQPEPA